MSTPEAGEVQGLEKATNTDYGNTNAQAGETDTMLETSPEHEAGDLSSWSRPMCQTCRVGDQLGT